jgi:hypothetical protein
MALSSQQQLHLVKFRDFYNHIIRCAILFSFVSSKQSVQFSSLYTVHFLLSFTIPSTFHPFYIVYDM